MDDDRDRSLGALAVLTLGGTDDALLAQEPLGLLHVPAGLLEGALGSPGSRRPSSCGAPEPPWR